MEHSQQDVVDDRPADAVSTLRSKFEKLNEQPTNIVQPNNADKLPVKVYPGNVRATTPQQMSCASSPALEGNAYQPPVPRKPSRMVSSRPHSLIEASFPSSETEITTLSRPLFFTAQSLPYGRHSVDVARPLVRAGTETLVTGNEQSIDGAASSHNSEYHIPVVSGKPQVPVKKPNLSNKFRLRSTVEANEFQEGASIGATFLQPKFETDEATPQRAKNNVGIGERKRVDSNASWVEHLPDTPEHTALRKGVDASDTDSPLSESPQRFTDSSASKKWKTRPARVRSNASWVENIDDDDNLKSSPKKTFVTPALPNVSEQPPRLPARPIINQQSLGKVSRQDHAAERSRTLDDETPNDKSSSSSFPPLRSALSQGFDRLQSSEAQRQTLRTPPVLPAPRRSLDRRRELERPTSAQSLGQSHLSTTDLSDAALTDTNESSSPAFPDSTSINRYPPQPKHRPFQIPTGYDTRVMTVCNDIVCTTGFLTRAWDLATGEEVLGVPHQETVKVTAVIFKPTLTPDQPSTHLWLGTTLGEIHEVDIVSQEIVKTSQKAHRGREVVKLYRHKLDMWSLDESGELVVWQKDRSGLPSPHSQFLTRRIHRGHTFSIVCDGRLWLATGKDIRVYKPSSSADSDFFVTPQALTQANIGEITSGAILQHRPDILYFGHSDGKISIYNRSSFQCERVVHASLYKIHVLTGIGELLWAGFGTGTIQIYDVSTPVWQVKKEWHAHDKQICNICVDSAPTTSEDPLRVVTLATDNTLKLWDGSLEEDWTTDYLSRHDDLFCNFEELSIAVLTWNAGASKPSHVENSKGDSFFMQNYLNHVQNADILVFGFQELVDLEDKKLTAKSIFKSKKKDAFEQEHMTHQYRAWRDYISQNLQVCAPRTFTLLHTASMIGLFSCCFVRSSLRSRIKYVHQAEVKRGMGGHYGNKGALILRMLLDDSSLCFVNCHLAAGQTQTSSRNNDAAAILDAETLPSFPLVGDEVQHSDVFAGGGSGSMIMDHEICVLNGDLNYRIDTMSRDTVVKHIQQGNFKRLLERDQLFLSRKKYPGFRLRAFQEKAITFEPTYKYNVNSNEYDTSEKRRSPAWCDRILYRGVGKVKCEEYRRWELRVSDHRPVSALIKCRVKKVDLHRRAKVLNRCTSEFGAYKQEVIALMQ